MYKIKQFFRNIHNLIRWFPIIWKDRDWDDHFIFEILTVNTDLSLKIHKKKIKIFKIYIKK
jgi:hypothetical protein